MVFNLTMKRYTQLPLTLYRIQYRMPVNLRRYDNQMKMVRSCFDLKTHNGIVKPLDDPRLKNPVPNGMELRPASDFLAKSLEYYDAEPTIYCLSTGLQLPSEYCIYREHRDHYSLQTTKDIGYDEFNKNLTDFLNSLPRMTKAVFLEKCLMNNT
jgi:hypothetical protein